MRRGQLLSTARGSDDSSGLFVVLLVHALLDGDGDGWAAS